VNNHFSVANSTNFWRWYW